MRSLHKYNFIISSVFMIISLVNFLTVNEIFIHALIFGYIYSCFWTYMFDRLDAKGEVSG